MSLPVRKKKLLLVGAGNLCLQILKILGPKNAFDFVVLGRNEEATIRLCNLVALSCAQLGQFIDIKPVVADLTDVGKVTQLLREELNRLHADYQTRHQKGMARLEADTNWQQLEPEQRNSLLATQKLTLSDAPKIQVANTEEVQATVDRLSLSSFTDRVAAIDSRFDAVLVAAAELMEPKAQFVKLPHRTIKTDEDIEAWLQDAKQTIEQALKKGPVILH